MRKQLMTLMAALALPVLASAQKVITFESHSDIHKKKHKAEDGANSITLGMGSALVNGYLPLYYERKLTDFLSISVGGGVTYRSYMNDLGTLVWDDGLNTNYSSSDDVTDNYASYKYRKATPGFYASVAPRFYVNDEALNGFYISPAVEIKQYNYAAKLANAVVIGQYYGSVSDDLVPRSETTMSEYMHCVDLTFNSGGHYQLQNHLVLGWNIGVGVRLNNSRRLDVGAESNGTDYYYVNHVRDFSTTRPLFTFNFVLGGWF